MIILFFLTFFCLFDQVYYISHYSFLLTFLGSNVSFFMYCYDFLGDDLFYIDRADILVFGNYIKVFLCTNFEVLVIRELMNGH